MLKLGRYQPQKIQSSHLKYLWNNTYVCHAEKTLRQLSILLLPHHAKPQAINIMR